MKYLGSLILLLCAAPGLAQVQGPITFNAGAPAVTFAPVSYFGWLPPMATLPSDMQCAEEIAQTPEGIPANAAMNAHAPSSSDLAPFLANPNGDAGQVLPPGDYARVDGAYPSLLKAAPSTDMIIRWAACKWGVNEDALRAQLWEESTWRQDTPGDMHTAQSDCTQTGFTALYDSTITFLSGTRAVNQNGCWQSWGIGQEKVWYFDTLWPMVKDSTAFAVDFRAGAIRGCINGDQKGYFQSNGTDNMGAAQGIPSYETATGTTLDWYCEGSHLSGSWADPSAQAYVAALQGFLAQNPKPWPGGL